MMNSADDVRRVLVITADDFGYDVDRNRGIVECFRCGAVTRASLLVNGSASLEAAELARIFDIPLGLHLNLTEGIPVSSPGEVKSLLTEKGHFLGKHGFREALESGTVLLDEVRSEVNAQIKKFKLLMENQLPGHVDGHQHVHVLPGVCRVFSEVLSANGINSVRLPYEPDLESCTYLSPGVMEFYKTVVAQSVDAGKCFLSQGIRFPDAFLGMSLMGSNMNSSQLQKSITKCFARASIWKTISSVVQSENLQPQEITCELMVHPGYRCSNVEKGGCGTGADEFSTSNDREHEMEVLCDEGMKQFYTKFNIQLSR